MVINVTKLMATNTVNIKQIIAEEYKRCAIDPVYFFKKYCYIQHPTLGRIKFNLFKFQEKLLSELFKFDYSLILKSRQMGISTLSAGISLHLMIFNKDKNVLVIATKQEVAKNMVNKVRFMYDNLPSWLKEPYVENNKLNLKLANGSQIKASSSSGDAGRSEAVSMLIVDEAAFIIDIEEIWGSAQQTLACIDKNSLISTDKGLFRFEDLKSEYFDFGFNDFNINIINRYGEIEKSNSFYISKESDTLELEFEDGNRIIVTKKHPLLLNLDGNETWVHSENLKIGDEIKCLYNTNIFGSEILYPIYEKYRKYNKSLVDMQISNDDMAYFTGLWIAEGHFGSKKLKSSPIGITNSDIEIQNWLKDKFGFQLIDDRHLTVGFSELYKRLIWLGCKRGAKNKNIPNKILHSSKSEQISFLQGIFDGDGCSTKRGDIKYSSVSKQLILDLHHVLLNFGIKSHIKFIDNTNSEVGHKSTVIRSDYRYVGYNLLIYGENARKFFEIIGFRLHRKQKRYNDNFKNGTIIKVDKDLVKNLILKSGYTLSYFNNNIAHVDRLLWFNSNGIIKDTLEKILQSCDENLYEYKELEKLKEHNDNYYYNKLVSIRDAGKRITYDLKVPSSESFLANFIVNHNTGGKSIVLSTPNGISNWFHKQWVNAKQGKNKFNPIQLHWKMHPDRNQAWRDEQDLILGPRLAAQECFDANTRIYTKTGLKKISDIKVGDYVLTHKGRFKQVLRTYSHIDNDLLEIHSYNNKNIRYVTKNHPFMNMNNEWINICDIKNEQVLRSLPTNIDYDFNTEDIIFDLYENLNIHNIKAKNNSVYINDRRHKTIHNRYIKMDYDAGYVIGLYLAEGSKSKYRTVFSFNNETERYTWPMRLQKIIEDKFGLKNYTFRYKGSNTCDLEISSKIFSSFISFFVNGNRCYNKYLSDHIYDFNNREFYSGILDGVFRGDGCLTNTANKKISITSQSLIYDLKYISVLLGYTLSSIRIVNKEYKENYKSSWSDKNYNYHDTYILSFYTTKNVNINTEFTDNYVDDLINYSYKNSIFKNDMFISSKIYIEDSDAILPVYNIEVESDNSYVTEHFVAHNCDADFLSSGNTVVGVDTLKFYKDTFIKDPIEKRGPNKELWIWESPVYTNTYMISSDVSRGDGSDYSSAHVIDVETMTQVAEFKGLISTKDFGNFLVGLATEYNDALLIVENSTIGWAVLQQIIDRKYKNLYYTEQNLTYVDDKKYTYSGKIKTVEKKSVPGFTTSPKTRPLIINKLEYYFNQRDIILQSDRCLDELYAFIWNGNRAEAMKGYNDDLVMALAIGLWVRDTALQLGQLKIEATKANLDSITVIRPESAIYIPGGITVHDQWNIPTGIPGQEEDISTWML